MNKKQTKSPVATHSIYWPLFKHMAENHGLTLLDSEMVDIIQVVNGLKRYTPKGRK